jgi:hypothetical protein
MSSKLGLIYGTLDFLKKIVFEIQNEIDKIDEQTKEETNDRNRIFNEAKSCVEEIILLNENFEGHYDKLDSVNGPIPEGIKNQTLQLLEKLENLADIKDDGGHPVYLDPLKQKLKYVMVREALRDIETPDECRTFRKIKYDKIYSYDSNEDGVDLEGVSVLYHSGPDHRLPLKRRMWESQDGNQTEIKYLDVPSLDFYNADDQSFHLISLVEWLQTLYEDIYIYDFACNVSTSGYNTDDAAKQLSTALEPPSSSSKRRRNSRQYGTYQYYGQETPQPVEWRGGRDKSRRRTRRRRRGARRSSTRKEAKNGSNCKPVEINIYSYI